MPKTKIGKISFWLVVFGLLFVIIIGAIAGIIDSNTCDADGVCAIEAESLAMYSTRIIPSLLGMLSLVVGGITSIIAVVKYHDKAISLFISALIGIMGIIFVLGEFLVPH